MISQFSWSIIKNGFPLIKNVLIPLAESVSIPLGSTKTRSTPDVAIKKKFFGSGMATLIISNEEMEDIIKIVKSLKDPGFLIKGISETIENEAKEQK